MSVGLLLPSFHLDMNDFFHAPLKPSVLHVQGENAGVTFSPSGTAESCPEERVFLCLTGRLTAFKTRHLGKAMTHTLTHTMSHASRPHRARESVAVFEQDEK